MSMTLIHGDCLDVMKKMPDNCIDLTVTSPPYDNLRTYNNTLVWDFEVFKPIARHFIGIEKDETYFNLAKNRIKEAEQKNKFKLF